MTESYPVPPPELVQQWQQQEPYVGLLAQAPQWGADQELETCCHEVQKLYGVGRWLRYVRRPKPPSLKEQALEQLRALDQHGALDCNTDKIRRALEALDD
jgi:hypothetical protein